MLAEGDSHRTILVVSMSGPRCFRKDVARRPPPCSSDRGRAVPEARAVDGRGEIESEQQEWGIQYATLVEYVSRRRVQWESFDGVHSDASGRSKLRWATMSPEEWRGDRRRTA